MVSLRWQARLFVLAAGGEQCFSKEHRPETTLQSASLYNAIVEAFDLMDQDRL